MVSVSFVVCVDGLRVVGFVVFLLMFALFGLFDWWNLVLTWCLL